ncbi:AI-2E family transporter [Halomicronema hongdechloris C2206]|uniref:AI-2E family transporter n=1 Tax=Halomicronema hongdechloris C2206 TaxID=1641165 RepID=A0A1Z3HL79_9CYAN|nr:AI-2E family transporter [Halomicronema hongdechloris]ASC71079.1 AI-2E family transporter [Halomicronema hongdechloris C2206]
MSQPESSTSNSIALWWDTLRPLSQLLAIALAAPLILLNAWAFSQIFAYFRSLFIAVVIAALLAFLLNYPISWLQQRGLGRGAAAVVVFLVALVGFLLLGITVLPLVISQAQQLVAKLPDWFESGKSQLLLLDERLKIWGLPFNLDALVAQVSDRLKAELQTLAGEALNLTVGVAVFTAGKLLDVLLTLILTFYLLLSGPEVWASLINWLPPTARTAFSKTLRRSFRNYFTGQLIIASCLGAALMAVFLLLNIPFALLFALTIGGMALIPFGSTVGIVLVTLLMALRDIGIAVKIFLVAEIVQQSVDNGLAPRVLGSVTGLNPFWVLVAILCGARIGGLLGVVLAVPTAVIVKDGLRVIRALGQSQPLPEAELSELADPGGRHR